MNYQIAQEADAQMGSDGGMCQRPPKRSTEREACAASHTSCLSPLLRRLELALRKRRFKSRRTSAPEYICRTQAEAMNEHASAAYRGPGLFSRASVSGWKVSMQLLFCGLAL
jgi:hypothetical protein